MIKQKVDLHIEALVLHGFSPGDRYRIGKALQLELTRLISEKIIPDRLSHDVEIARMKGGTFNMPSNSRPEIIGNQIARSVYKGFEK